MSITYSFHFGIGYQLNIKSAEELGEEKVSEFFDSTDVEQDESILPIFNDEEFDKVNSEEAIDFLAYEKFNNLEYFDFVESYSEANGKSECVLFIKESHIKCSVGGGSYNYPDVPVVFDIPDHESFNDEMKAEIEQVFDWFVFLNLNPKMIVLSDIN